MSALSAGGSKPASASLTATTNGSCESQSLDVGGIGCRDGYLQGSGIPGMVVGRRADGGSHATFGALMSMMECDAREKCEVALCHRQYVGAQAWTAGVFGKGRPEMCTAPCPRC